MRSLLRGVVRLLIAAAAVAAAAVAVRAILARLSGEPGASTTAGSFDAWPPVPHAPGGETGDGAGARPGGTPGTGSGRAPGSGSGAG